MHTFWKSFFSYIMPYVQLPSYISNSKNLLSYDTSHQSTRCLFGRYFVVSYDSPSRYKLNETPAYSYPSFIIQGSWTRQVLMTWKALPRASAAPDILVCKILWLHWTCVQFLSSKIYFWTFSENLFIEHNILEQLDISSRL